MSLGIVQQLIANLAILTAFLFLLNMVIFKNRTIDASTTWRTRALFGFLSGLLGIILMIFSVQMRGALLDYRQLAIVISALYGGPLSSIITAGMIFPMRLLAFGGITAGSALAAANSIAIALVVGMISGKRGLSFWSKWSLSILTCNLMTMLVFFVNLGVDGLLPAAIYVTMMTIGGLAAAWLIDFLAKANAHLHQLNLESATDYLTGLNNSRTFESEFQSKLRTAKEQERCLSVAMIDIDYFKCVNDTYGHANGDAVLRQLGGLLEAAARRMDSVSRNGGEEFALLMYDTPHERALRMAEELRAIVQARPFLLTDGTSMHITVSIGVATYPDADSCELVETADAALYEAKRSGRNRVCSSSAIAQSIE